MATILLDDGKRIECDALDVPGVAVGELSPYTGHDYLSPITDPAFAGVIPAFTMPETGLWGINTESCESGAPIVRAAIFRRVTEHPRNWRCAETLSYFLRRNLVLGVTGVDTLALSRYCTSKKIKKCAVVTSPDFDGWDALLYHIRDFVPESRFPAAVKTPTTYGDERGALAHLAVCDFGSSMLLAKLLRQMRFRVTLLPPYDCAAILSRAKDTYDGLIIPNGAGSPRSQPGLAQGLRDVIDSGLPVLGYGLGFHLIAMAMGVRPVPMESPHKGQWYPAQDLSTGQIIYTRQHHAHTLPAELPPPLICTHKSPEDQSPEGFRVEGKPCIARQFLPFPDLRLGGTGGMIRDFTAFLKGENAHAS